MLHLGWPARSLLVGCAGFLWLAFWWPVYRTPALGREAKRRSPPFRCGILSAPASSSRFTVAKIFFDPVWYFYIFWFPEYLKQARGFDLAAIGTYAWIPFAVAGAGNFAGGMLSAFLLRRGPLAHARAQRRHQLLPAADDRQPFRRCSHPKPGNPSRSSPSP